MKNITNEQTKKISEELRNVEKQQDEIMRTGIDRGHDIEPPSASYGEIPSAGQGDYF